VKDILIKNYTKQYFDENSENKPMMLMLYRNLEKREKREKRMPKILAPINSFDGTVKVIDAGADEIYCGVALPGKYKNFVLYRGPGASSAQLSSYDELEKIVKYAHRHNVKVVLVVNEPFMSEDLEETMKSHIRSCVDKGVDALMIGDFGVLSIVKELNVDVTLIASTYFVSMNSEAVDLLEKLGFSRVVLERHLTLQEISEIIRHSKVDIEVFCHHGGCSNINASCYFYHVKMPDKIKQEWRRMAKDVGRHTAPCTIPYDIYEITEQGEEWVDNAPILDALTFCSLCHVQALIDAGVAGLKIVGRFRPWHGHEGVATNVKIYRKFLDIIMKDSRRSKRLREVVTMLRKECDRLMIEECKRVLRSQGGGRIRYLPYYEFYCKQKRCIFSNLFNAPYKIRDLKPREIRL